MIECRNVSKTFIQKGSQEVPVLDDVSIDVQANEFVVILGPAACSISDNVMK